MAPQIRNHRRETEKTDELLETFELRFLSRFDTLDGNKKHGTRVGAGGGLEILADSWVGLVGWMDGIVKLEVMKNESK